MSSATEHREQLERELANVGIKPDMELTEGGHLRIRWKHGGMLRVITTSSTPSDHRSTLNARARIRRILREDGVFNQQPCEKPKLAKALAVPIDHGTDRVRIERMEDDIGVLLDMLGDLIAKLGIKLEDLAPPPPPPPAPVVARKKRDSSWRHEFLLCLEYQAISLDLITQRAGCTYGNASVRLNTLKKDGLVENTGRGMWRKVRQASGAKSRHVNGNGAALR